MESDLSLIEIAGEDDSLLQQTAIDDVSSLNTKRNNNNAYFVCSPLQLPRSKPIEGMVPNVGGEGTTRSFYRDSVNKENLNVSKEEVTKLSIEPQQMKRKKKGGGYNLRKSLAWDRAFFTEEGVLDPVELSMISGNFSKSKGETLSTIREEATISASDSLPLQALEENFFKELPATKSEKCRKNLGGLLPKKDSSARCNDAPTSMATRKVLSAHDVNRSGSKRSGCPRPVASSSLKRPANLVPTKTSGKDSKVSKLVVQKPGSSASSRTAKSSTLGAIDSKQNQITRPVINVQKYSGLKSSSNNTKNVLNNSKAGPAGKSLTTKTSLGQAKRNVTSSVKCALTNVQLPLKTEANNDVELIPNPSLPSTGFASNVHDGGSSKSAIPLPQNAHRTGFNVQQTQLQRAKPSGLRMPSPSLGFFGQSKAPHVQSPLKRPSQTCNLPESNISNLRKLGAPNTVFELRPLLAPGNFPEVIKDGTPAGNVKASYSSSGCSVIHAVNPALHETVESDSQVTNMQKLEQKIQCNENSYEAVKNQKELHSTFVAMDQQDLEQAGKGTTKSTSHMENIILRRIDNVLLLRGTLQQLDKCDTGTSVGDGSAKSTKRSKLEYPHVPTYSSSAIEVQGFSVTNDITDHKLAEDKAYCLSLKDHGDFSDFNPGNRNANKAFGEQAVLVNPITCEVGPVFIDNQMLPDNVADISSEVQDYNAAEIEKFHSFVQFMSIEEEKDDSGVLDKVRTQSNVEDTLVQSLDGYVTVESTNSNLSTVINNQHKIFVDNVIEKPEDLEVAKFVPTSENNLQDGVMLHVEQCLFGEENVVPQETKEENVLQSDELEGIKACESELKSSSTPPCLIPVAMLDCGSDVSKLAECKNHDNNPSVSVDSEPVVENYKLDTQFKHFVDNVIEKPEGPEFPKSVPSRENNLQDGVMLHIEQCLFGEENVVPQESKEENVLQSDELEGIKACESELKSSSTPCLIPEAMLDSGSDVSKLAECKNHDNNPSVSVDSEPVVENYNLDTQFKHDVGPHDQSTFMELRKIDEHHPQAVSAEDVNATFQKSEHSSDSVLENPYITSEQSLIVQVEGEHDGVEDKKFILSIEGSSLNASTQQGDDFSSCHEDSSMGQMYMTRDKNDVNKQQEDQDKHIAPDLCETDGISYEEKKSPEAPCLFENSPSLEDPQIFKNGNSTNVGPKVNVHDGSGSESPLTKHMDEAFKESDGVNYLTKEEAVNSKLENRIDQVEVEKVSPESVPGVDFDHVSPAGNSAEVVNVEDEDVKREDKKSGMNKKQDVLVIKPPSNATPFSDEWLAAFEAAGEEILTMKSGAVQNSPQDKSQPEPSPWSPVKRKSNQAIGPYDCTKYTNTNP